MKKQLLLLLLVVAFAVKASAQTKSIEGMKLNVAVEGILPVGDASDAYSFGLGLTAKIEVPVVKSLYLTANTGFNNLFFKDDIKKVLSAFGDNSSSRLFIPLEAGLRYYANDNFYAEGQVGAAIGTKSGVGTAFAYTPGFGLVLPASNGGAFDIGFRYEGWAKNGTTLGFIGLRAAYKFAL